MKTIIWFLFSAGFLFCIYDTYYWIYGKSFNRWVSAFFYPSTRIIWAMNTATLIWMCISGNGGFVNKFFSWKAFIPFSRLTYSVYLTHVWIDWYYWGTKRDLIDMNNFSYLFLFCGFLLMSYIIGAIFSLLFESPFFVLQKCLRNYFVSNQKNKIFYNSHDNGSNNSEMKDLYRSLEKK